jgi:hypothetical protein
VDRSTNQGELLSDDGKKRKEKEEKEEKKEKQPLKPKEEYRFPTIFPTMKCAFCKFCARETAILILSFGERDGDA